MIWNSRKIIIWYQLQNSAFYKAFDNFRENVCNQIIFLKSNIENLIKITKYNDAKKTARRLKHTELLINSEHTSHYQDKDHFQIHSRYKLFRINIYRG